eukprot:g15785.t1
MRRRARLEGHTRSTKSSVPATERTPGHFLHELVKSLGITQSRNMPSLKRIVPASFVLLLFVTVPVLAEANDGDSNSTRRGQRNGCENMSEDEVEANAYRLFIGILIAIIGGLVSSFGLVYQKYAHKLNEGIPKEERGNCKVITGFMIYILGTAIFLVASPYAPQSVLSALASVNLVGNAVWAPLLLGENIGKADFTGLVFICGGIVLVVIFGNQCSLSYTADEIVRLFLAVGQMLYFFSVMSIVILLILGIRLTENTFWESFDAAIKMKAKKEEKEKARKIDKLKRELTNSSIQHVVNMDAGDDDGAPSIPQKRKSMIKRLATKQKRRSSFEYNTLYDMRIQRGKRLALSFALVAAILAGYATVLVKIVLTLVEVSANGDNQFVQFSTYVFILFLIVFEVIHINYLNNGLRHFDAMLFVPMFMVSMTVITSISGGIFFQEFVNFTVLQYIFYPLGLLCTVIGVFILSQRDAAKKAEHSETPVSINNLPKGRSKANSWPLPNAGAGGDPQSPSSNGNDNSIGDVEMVPVENPMLKSKPEVKSNRDEVGQDNEHIGESRKRTASSIV